MNESLFYIFLTILNAWCALIPERGKYNMMNLVNAFCSGASLILFLVTLLLI